MNSSARRSIVMQDSCEHPGYDDCLLSFSESPTADWSFSSELDCPETTRSSATSRHLSPSQDLLRNHGHGFHLISSAMVFAGVGGRPHDGGDGHIDQQLHQHRHHQPPGQSMQETWSTACRTDSASLLTASACQLCNPGSERLAVLSNSSSPEVFEATLQEVDISLAIDRFLCLCEDPWVVSILSALDSKNRLPAIEPILPGSQVANAPSVRQTLTGIWALLIKMGVLEDECSVLLILTAVRECAVHHETTTCCP